MQRLKAALPSRAPEPPAAETKTWTCPECGRSAEVASDAETTAWEMCQGCSRRRDWTKLLVAAEVPNRFLTVAADEPIVKPLDTWSGTPWCAVLVGPNESGKTHAATRLLGELLVTRARSGLWINCAHAIHRMKREFEHGPDSRGAYLADRMMRVGALLVDDIGAARQTEYSLEQLQLVIGSRYDNQRPTIVTSDVALEELPARIASRLQEVHPDTGESFVIQRADHRWRQRRRP